MKLQDGFEKTEKRGKMKRFVCLFSIIFVALSGAEAADFDHKHTDLDRLLKKVVDSQGQVDYERVRKNDALLQSYMRELKNLPPKELARFREPQELALWINAYNAFTLKMVADFYPEIRSIRDIASQLTSFNITSTEQWKVSSYERGDEKVRFLVANKPRSLDEIEHKIIRPKFKDARIHAAVNCASKGCPKLRNEAYTPNKLDQQLTDSMRTFLAEHPDNELDIKTKTLKISEIFKWFKEDFIQNEGSLVNYVKRYSPDEWQDFLNKNEVNVQFSDYSWALNGPLHPKQRKKDDSKKSAP